MAYLQAKAKLHTVLGQRYLAKRGCRKSGMNIFEHDLHEEEDGTHWMNDSDFKKKYRMSREMLDKITKEIEGHDVFKRGKRGARQRPVKHQLMIFLHFVGKEGESNTGGRNTFQISEGSCEKARERVVEALVSLRDKYITWPDEDERKEIAERIERLFLFPNCVGLMDGTLCELALRPRAHDASDYHGRKYAYSLTIMVINDDRRRIRAYLAGYPGSAHDNRVWKAMPQSQSPEKYFTSLEYVLCDTAFEPSDHAIPSYKCLTGFVQDRDEELFNTALGSPRVISEHTMGIWKGRFPWLRKIRMIITDDPDSLYRILWYIDATVILHNMLIEFGGEKPASDWNVDADMSDADDATRLPEERVLGLPIPGGAPKGTRREQLKNLIREKWVPSHNFRPVLYRDDDGSDFEEEEEGAGK